MLRVTSETGSAAQRSVLSTSATAFGKVGSFATVAVALVTDVLAPVGPLALYLAALAALVLLVFLLPERVAAPVHAFGQRRFPGYWRVPVLVTVAVSAVLLVGAHVITRSAPAGGWLGSHVSAVHGLQGDLGILEAQTQEIAETTHAIKEDTEAIDETTKGIKEDTEEINTKLDGLKTETSDDPRKELANIGVEWSTQSFVDAMKAGDARVVTLFLQGGMSPAVVHHGASAVLFILQPGLPDPIPMFKLMIAAGFDLDTNLLDALIMRDYGVYGSMPPFWDSPNLPPHYGGGTFGGPVLLWLAIRSAYGITEAWDIDVIDFLRSQGADAKLVRQFLNALDSAWGDTPTYETVRAAMN